MCACVCVRACVCVHVCVYQETQLKTMSCVNTQGTGGRVTSLYIFIVDDPALIKEQLVPLVAVPLSQRNEHAITPCNLNINISIPLLQAN